MAQFQATNKVILPTSDLSHSLFGKRIRIPLTQEDTIRDILVPDWKHEEYFMKQSAHAQALYSFIHKSNYKSRTTAEVEKFYATFNYIELYKTLFKAKNDHKLPVDTTRRFIIEYIPKRSLVFNYGTPQ